MSPYACVAHGRLPITPLEPFSAHLLGNTAFYEQERYPDGLSQLPSRLALSSSSEGRIDHHRAPRLEDAAGTPEDLFVHLLGHFGGVRIGPSGRSERGLGLGTE